MMIESTNKEKTMMKHVETVEEFLARGGAVKQCAPAKAHGAQKAQTIKCPGRKR